MPPSHVQTQPQGAEGSLDENHPTGLSLSFILPSPGRLPAHLLRQMLKLFSFLYHGENTTAWVGQEKTLQQGKAEKNRKTKGSSHISLFFLHIKFLISFNPQSSPINFLDKEIDLKTCPWWVCWFGVRIHLSRHFFLCLFHYCSLLYPDVGKRA